MTLSHTRNIFKNMQGVLWILFTQRQAIKQNINCLKDIKMLFRPRSVQNSKSLIIIIGRTGIYSIQMFTDGGI